MPAKERTAEPVTMGMRPLTLEEISILANHAQYQQVENTLMRAVIEELNTQDFPATPTFEKARVLRTPLLWFLVLDGWTRLHLVDEHNLPGKEVAPVIISVPPPTLNQGREFVELGIRWMKSRK